MIKAALNDGFPTYWAMAFFAVLTKFIGMDILVAIEAFLVRNAGVFPIIFVVLAPIVLYQQMAFFAFHSRMTTIENKCASAMIKLRCGPPLFLSMAPGAIKIQLASMFIGMASPAFPAHSKISLSQNDPFSRHFRLLRNVIRQMAFPAIQFGVLPLQLEIYRSV